MKLTRIGEMTEADRRICLIGVVIHSMENFILIEDGTGRAKVYVEGAPKFAVKSILLVIADVLSARGELKEVEAEVSVDLSGIDLRLLKKSLELEEKLEELEGKLEGADSDAS